METKGGICIVQLNCSQQVKAIRDIFDIKDEDGTSPIDILPQIWLL